ncbi:MAG: sodium-dependent transporter [Bacteroidales bacterium]|nr:sodium-dependent transporter [Candidatus Cryptobacteroides equifaecalis]
MAKREKFGSRMAYVMALAGSAIGLGNIWRFPYIVGEHGGALFILVYLFFSFVISMPILFGESVIGKKSHRSTYDAMDMLAPGTGWKYLGLLTVISPFIIVSYYSVVGGWSIDYLVRSCAGGLNCASQESAAALFSRSSSTAWETLASFTAFLLLTAGIIVLGVKKGIEKFSKLAMPALFFLIVFIAIYSMTLPGSMEGVKYLVKPDFSKFGLDTLSFALGQSFYSLSLGVGIVLTYSSYMKDEDSVVKSGTSAAVFDSLFAILAGFAIMPAVFAAGIKPGAGPALIFESLPYTFSCMSEQMPVVGAVVTFLFFLTILTAALTSSVSLYEVCESHLIERWKMSRLKASAIIFVAAWLLGASCALSFGPLKDVEIFGNSIFGFCDLISSNYLMTLGALAFSIFAGWKMKKADVQSEVGSFFYFMIRWVSPIVIIVIFISNMLL